eukprot:XP_020404523.1 classical arabinogalactan protein 9-like [Zea mays]
MDVDPAAEAAAEAEEHALEDYNEHLVEMALFGHNVDAAVNIDAVEPQPTPTMAGTVTGSSSPAGTGSGSTVRDTRSRKRLPTSRVWSDFDEVTGVDDKAPFFFSFFLSSPGLSRAAAPCPPAPSLPAVPAPPAGHPPPLPPAAGHPPPRSPASAAAARPRAEPPPSLPSVPAPPAGHAPPLPPVAGHPPPGSPASAAAAAPRAEPPRFEPPPPRRRGNFF